MPFNIKDIEEKISEHMDAQPYKLECGGCGDALEFCKSIDTDYDLTVTAEPCKTCMVEQFDIGQSS
jgi:hypothetical protein